MNFEAIGVSPPFNTLGHPQASGHCDRLVKSTKNIFNKQAYNSPCSWRKYVEAAVWALHESLNETTGVAPYLLVFGHLPKGPLSVLKEHWSGESDLPLDLGKSTTEYLQDLKNKLETAQVYAETHTNQTQQRCTHHSKLGSHDR